MQDIDETDDIGGGNREFARVRPVQGYIDESRAGLPCAGELCVVPLDRVDRTRLVTDRKERGQQCQAGTQIDDYPDAADTRADKPVDRVESGLELKIDSVAPAGSDIQRGRAANRLPPCALGHVAGLFCRPQAGPNCEKSPHPDRDGQRRPNDDTSDDPVEQEHPKHGGQPSERKVGGSKTDPASFEEPRADLDAGEPKEGRDRGDRDLRAEEYGDPVETQRPGQTKTNPQMQAEEG